MDEDDLIELSAALDIDYDDTIIVLFKRGVALASSTDETNMSSTRIKSHSIFKK
ncbi:hypothetical protein [Aeromonas caviae]|jgi:hypothetical protein|nr:hypothetical protein [Aeromonas caviae]